MEAKTLAYAGVGALFGAIALNATRGVTKLSKKNARNAGLVLGAGLGYVGGRNITAGKTLLGKDKPAATEG